jgi:Protein of unknown function (DUF742)
VNWAVDPDGREPPALHRVRPFLRDRAVAAGPLLTPPEPEDPQATAPRPFVITAGRVDGTDPDIGVETQVAAHPGAAPARLPPEARAIVALCAEPLSVAEISARLRLHLGVTRILVGDLRAAGQLDVHVGHQEFPDPETILRVIRGLRALN